MGREGLNDWNSLGLIDINFDDSVAGCLSEKDFEDFIKEMRNSCKQPINNILDSYYHYCVEKVRKALEQCQKK
jgi:hypothetical protein